MEHSKDFFLDLLENIDVGVFVLDAEGRFLFVNDTYCSMLNKKPEFYENTSISELKKQGYLSFSVWEQVIEKKEQVVSFVTVTDDDLNRIQQFFTSAIPTFNEDGSIKYIYYVVESFENIMHRIQVGILNKQNYQEIDIINKSADINIIAESPKMKQLIQLLSIVSKTDASVLISGPTGSGKEVLAEYTHRISHRSSGPFISVDCTSIPDNLLESELFGYEKGAFTGASSQGKVGLIESANGGTLFLDEINSMPLGLQGKLLRVLETRQVKRLGALKARPIDFRLVSASNEALEALVHQGSFRPDLYYRINVVPIHIPPLRERKEDIAPLTLYFLQHFCNKYSHIKVISEDLMNALLAYEWPGNVRELKNLIERIVVTSNTADLTFGGLSSLLLQHSFSSHESSLSSSQVDQSLQPDFLAEGFSYRAYMDRCEKQLIQAALAQFKSPLKVAEALNLDLSNVYRKMRKHQI
ncbi:sigma-54 interaction domain-containing protein [Geosporobacter ferrireducens]|uniref:sigma-54 interaction domain-containing protein n=1 Tax=Geosporobacter ferrireducens TaxID=1424294 RepID=UPI00139E0995|nr:sigma 54-interacting transcriptional regulator [Geosporobacter ferrireducens]MTI56583.1 PAS domain-containing protein [Geosporobacter ferrireducens]